MAQIFLGPGDNTFTGTTAGDVIFGEAGNDKITASAGGNVLYGGLGADVLLGGAGSDTISGDDQVGDMALNTLKGFGGNDFIASYSWNDQVDAGNGDDTVSTYAQQTGQFMDGGNGTDIIEIRSLSASLLPVNVTMGPVCVTTIGGVAGATYLNFEVLHFYGGIARNTITGGAGDDFLLTAYLNGSNATNEFDAGFVRGMAGNDIIAFNGITALGTGVQQMSGGTGTDRLSWTSGESGITDLAVDGLAGTMTGMGRIFTRFDGFETLELLVYSPHTGNLDYTGIDGIDSLRVEFTTATINGRGGDDTFSLTLGSGTVNGGAGNDRIDIWNSTGAILVHGDGGNDTLSGSIVQSALFGDGGDDAISGYNDSALYGGSGDDILTLSLYLVPPGSGPALVAGGAGRDVAVLSFASSTSAFHGALTGPNLTLTNGTMLSGIEAVQLTTGSGNDTLTASNDALGASANQIHAFGGNDVLLAASNGALLDGYTGTDTLTGAAGADQLFGGHDADVLNDRLGNDTLSGGFGRDVMTGGTGADSFSFAYYFETSTTVDQADVITDFNQAEADRFDFSLFDANVLNGTLVDPFIFIANAGFHNVAGELRFQKFNPAGTANDHTLVSGDTNADGNADFTIWLSGLVTLTAADFGL